MSDDLVLSTALPPQDLLALMKWAEAKDTEIARLREQLNNAVSMDDDELGDVVDVMSRSSYNESLWLRLQIIRDERARLRSSHM